MIDLGPGHPSPSLLPLEAMAAAAARKLAGDPMALNYQPKRGDPAFLEALSTFLTRHYGHPVHADQLALTGGTSLALSMVGQLWGDASRPVVCSDPTYFHAASVFATGGLPRVGLPVDGEGLDVDALADRLDAGLKPSFVYCIPQFHNPCGGTLSPERARRLVALAEKHDFLVVADEPYALLHFGEPPPCMMSFDEGRGRVIALGSMSKILAPGLRLGWIHAAPALVERYLEHGVLSSGGCINPVIARLALDTLETGFLDEHVGFLRTTLGERAQRLAAALEAALGRPVAAPRGGYFLWLDLGEGHDTSALLPLARAEHAVGFTPGARCAVERDLRTCMRLSLSKHEAGVLEQGAEALGRAIRAARIS